MKILVIEDEQELLKVIGDYLTQEKYLCDFAQTFPEAESKLFLNEYDLVLLDITLPGGSGLELFKTLQQNNKNAGVIIISAKNSIDDKVTGLDKGADDYLAKPFNLSELNSRIKAVTRRKQFNGRSQIEFNEIVIDTESKSITVNGNELVLTKKEYELFMYMFVNKNRVLTKEVIAEHLWADNINYSDNLDFIYTHLNNVRKKISQAGGQDYIKTIYGMGYKFTDL